MLALQAAPGDDHFFLAASFAAEVDGAATAWARDKKSAAERQDES